MLESGATGADENVGATSEGTDSNDGAIGDTVVWTVEKSRTMGATFVGSVGVGTNVGWTENGIVGDAAKVGTAGTIGKTDVVDGFVIGTRVTGAMSVGGCVAIIIGW